MRRDEHARGLISYMFTASEDQQESATEWWEQLRELLRDAATEDAVGTIFELTRAAQVGFRRAAALANEDPRAYFQRWAIDDAADNEVVDDEESSGDL